jgi:hypothetical protein
VLGRLPLVDEAERAVLGVAAGEWDADRRDIAAEPAGPAHSDRQSDRGLITIHAGDWAALSSLEYTVTSPSLDANDAMPESKSRDHRSHGKQA